MDDKQVSGMTRDQIKLLCACVVGMAFGYPTLGPVMFGQFVVPLTKALGKSPDQVGYAISAMSIVNVFTAPFGGWLIDRLGARLVVITSALAMAIVFIALSATHNFLLVLALYATLSAVGAGTSPVAYSRPIVTHFTRHLGLALGIMLASIGVATATLPIAAVKTIETWGLSSGYWLLAVAAVTGIVPAYFILQKDRPTRHNDAGSDNATLREVRLYALAAPGGTMLAIALLLGVFTASVWGNAVPTLVAKGMSAADAALTMVALSIAMTVTRLIAGYALDRLFAPLVGALLLVPAIVGWLIFATSDSHTFLVIGMVTFGVALGAEIDIFSYLTSKYFPRRIYGTFFGLLFSMLGLGGALAQPVAVVIRSETPGTAGPGLVVAAVLTLVVALLLTLPRYGRFVKEASISLDDQERSE